MLEVRLIGKFDVRWDGKSVTLSSRAAQSLFAYLILTVGTLHRREKLAGMFWPDESEEKARAYLRNEIWRIRKALPHTSKVDYLIADNLTVGFNQSSSYRLDVDGLRNLSDNSSADELIHALSSYQRELLPGFYEDWIVLEREHLQVVFEQKIACLLQMLEKEQRWQDILNWAERWISLGQGPEAAYQALMFAYDALGEHAKVVSTYERCKQALRELDLEPSEQTRALAFKRNSKINIPIPLTSFIGREKELKEIADLLSKSRLVTLTGSGGVGKTRLAIQVVPDVLDRFPDGVWFLDLAPLTDPALVPNTLANLLGLRESSDIKLSVTDQLINYFRSRTALVIFDNCEHLIESSAQLVHSLLTSCEQPSILATSREALRVSGEIPYRVPSLDIPKSGIELAVDELSKMESVKLFTERAATVSLGFALGSQNALAVLQICRRLDGIPLAIELAAARVNILNVEEVLKQLQDSFSLLASGGRIVMQRHQTLRASMDWSWGLLSEAEQIFLRQLSIFAGGWTLESAQVVCDGDVLSLTSALVNKSLIAVNQAEGRETRYRFHEIVHQYAREKLVESGSSQLVRDRHLTYFVKLAERAEPELYRSDQVRWQNRLWDELDNLRLAMERALATDSEFGLRLIVSSQLFWDVHGNVRELEGWLVRLLEGYRGLDALRARALVIYSQMLFYRENFAKARVIAEESLELSRAISDRRAEAFSLWGLGILQDDLGQAKSLFEESLALYRSLGDKYWQAQLMREMGAGLAQHNSFDINLLLESLRLYREMGHLSAIAGCLCDLAHSVSRGGDFSSAAQWLEEARELYRQLGSEFGEAYVCFVYGHLAYWQGDFDQASAYAQRTITLCENRGVYLYSSWAHADLASAVLRQGDILRAKKIFGFCIQQFQKANSMGGLAFTIEGFASLNVQQKEPERAARLFGWVDATREKIDYPRPPVEQASVDRDLAMIHSQLSNDAFEEAYESGRVMTLDEAVTFALSDTNGYFG